MLAEYLQKLISTGCDELEIEYRDGKECFTAFKSQLGVGIGSLNSDKANPIFTELAELGKTKRVTVGNQSYALRLRQFEGFGETVYRIQMKAIQSSK